MEEEGRMTGFMILTSGHVTLSVPETEGSVDMATVGPLNAFEVQNQFDDPYVNNF